MLVSASVAWQSGQTAVSGSMNRSAGITGGAHRRLWRQPLLHIENCTRGTCARDKAVQMLAPDDWQPVLAQRASWRCSITGIGRSSWEAGRRAAYRELPARPSAGGATGGPGGE